MNIDSQRTNFTGQLKDFFKAKTFLPRLMLCMIAISAVSLFARYFSIQDVSLYQWIANFITLHSSFAIWFKIPWTLVSYAFIHFSFWTFLFNLLLLYSFGLLFSRYLGQKQFAYTYLCGIVFGGLFFMLLKACLPALFEDDLLLSGATPAVFSILFGIGYYLPNFKLQFALFGSVKLKNIVFVFVGLELLLLALNPDAMPLHLTNLFAGLVGIAVVFVTRKSKNVFKPSPKMKIDHRQGTRPLTDEKFNAIRAEKQKRLDVILGKISRSGYDSLTEEEKKFLFDTSNEKL